MEKSEQGALLDRCQIQRLDCGVEIGIHATASVVELGWGCRGKHLPLARGSPRHPETDSSTVTGCATLCQPFSYSRSERARIPT